MNKDYTNLPTFEKFSKESRRIKHHRRIEELSCNGKRGYRSKAHVKSDLKKMRQKYLHELIYYLCPFCGKYHIGHKE